MVNVVIKLADVELIDPERLRHDLAADEPPHVPQRAVDAAPFHGGISAGDHRRLQLDAQSAADRPLDYLIIPAGSKPDFPLLSGLIDVLAVIFVHFPGSGCQISMEPLQIGLQVSLQLLRAAAVALFLFLLKVRGAEIFNGDDLIKQISNALHAAALRAWLCQALSIEVLKPILAGQFTVCLVQSSTA